MVEQATWLVGRSDAGTTVLLHICGCRYNHEQSEWACRSTRLLPWSEPELLATVSVFPAAHCETFGGAGVAKWHNWSQWAVFVACVPIIDGGRILHADQGEG